MDWDSLKGAKIKLLPYKAKTVFYEMAKQDPKIEVPPRDERLEQMGEPKPPKMGGITPTSIDLPEVDDLLKAMNKVFPKTRKELLRVPMSGAVDYAALWKKEDEQSNDCPVRCRCAPCRRGDCGRCTADPQVTKTLEEVARARL